MVLPENQEFKNMSASAIAPEQRARQAIGDPIQLNRQSLFLLQQATQVSAEFLEIPICIVGAIQTNQRLKQIAVNFFETELEEIERLQELANKLPEISADDALWQEALDNRDVVAIRDPMTNTKWAKSIWIQKYGIRAFIGAPLISDSGDCLGILMGMDLAPRRFTRKDIQFLKLTTRWIVSELKRIELGASTQLQANQLPVTTGTQEESSTVLLDDLTTEYFDGDSLNQADPKTDSISEGVIQKAIALMTQEMRNPLTSVTGMAKVLNQEVYGKLNEKQKEYLNIIYDSGRYLVSLLDELVSLRSLNNTAGDLAIAGVDIEMLCQQTLNNLELEARRRGQELRLSVEPGDRLVFLDKSKVYQILYHLLARVIETAEPGGVIRLHVSRKTDALKMTIWVSHPWLGDGLNPLEMFDLADLANPLLNEPGDRPMSLERQMALEQMMCGKYDAKTLQLVENLISAFKTTNSSKSESKKSESNTGENGSPIKFSRQDLGILIGWQLTQQHQGQISLEGSPSYGYRYLIELPLMSEI